MSVFPTLCRIVKVNLLTHSISVDLKKETLPDLQIKMSFISISISFLKTILPLHLKIYKRASISFLFSYRKCSNSKNDICFMHTWTMICQRTYKNCSIFLDWDGWSNIFSVIILFAHSPIWIKQIIFFFIISIKIKVFR